MNSFLRSSPAIFLIVAISLNGCGTPPKKSPPPLQKAARHLNKGISVEDGNVPGDAEAEFLEGYRIYRSVEDYPGMLTSLLNLSKLYRARGESVRALEAVASAEKILPNDQSVAYEFWYEKGRLMLHLDKVSEALESSEKALLLAPESERGRMFILKGEAQLLRKEYESATKLAAEALSLSRKHGDRRLEATAEKLQGEVLLATGKYSSSIERFGAALLIDKELALSGRVASDLDALARGAEAAGDIKGAVGYLLRKVDLIRARIQSNEHLSTDYTRLALLYDRLGDREAAVKIRALQEGEKR